MRLGPVEVGRWYVRLAAPATRAAIPASAAIVQSTHHDQLLNIGGGLPTTIKFAIIDQMVNNIPFLDVGLRKFTRLVGGFGVRCDNEALQEAMDGFLGTRYVSDTAPVLVAGVQRGFQSFHTRHCRSMMTYGLALSEIALDGAGKDVDGLWPMASSQVRCRRDANGRMEFGQQTALGEPVWFDRQDLLLYNAANPEGDAWAGKPLVQSSQWVARTLLVIENAVRQMWWRHGAPSFAIWAEIDPGLAQNVPAGQSLKDQCDALTSGLRSEWTKGLQDRWENEGIRDFIMAGVLKIHFQAIGADVKELTFEAPVRFLMEQVLSTIELAPFMLGVSWATTERMSQHQADAIIAVGEDVRRELETDYLRVCRTKQQLIGIKGDLEPAWKEMSLRDEVETSRARLSNAQAARFEQSVALEMWRQGVIDQAGYAERVGVEIEGRFPVPRGEPAVPPGPGALAASMTTRVREGREAAFAAYP